MGNGKKELIPFFLLFFYKPPRQGSANDGFPATHGDCRAEIAKKRKRDFHESLMNAI